GDDGLDLARDARAVRGAGAVRAVAPDREFHVGTSDRRLRRHHRGRGHLPLSRGARPCAAAAWRDAAAGPRGDDDVRDGDVHDARSPVLYEYSYGLAGVPGAESPDSELPRGGRGARLWLGALSGHARRAPRWPRGARRSPAWSVAPARASERRLRDRHQDSARREQAAAGSICDERPRARGFT